MFGDKTILFQIARLHNSYFLIFALLFIAIALLGCQSPLQVYIAEHTGVELNSSETTIATKGKVAVAVVRPATAQVLAAIKPPTTNAHKRIKGKDQ